MNNFSTHSSFSTARKGSNKDNRARKQPTIEDLAACRFLEDFGQMTVIGSGSFGAVYRCTELSTELTFAVKVSKNAVTQSDLNEVSTHQMLGNHPNIVRYVSSWVEMDRMHTQMEFCNGGSLNSILEEQRSSNRRMSSSDLEILLAHTSAGLSHIHALNLAHLDVKPDNILVIFPAATAEDPINKSNLAGVVYKLGKCLVLTNFSVSHTGCNGKDKEISINIS